jgi:hypothetical protein
MAEAAFAELPVDLVLGGSSDLDLLVFGKGIFFDQNREACMDLYIYLQDYKGKERKGKERGACR